jgi:hypothetical protein
MRQSPRERIVIMTRPRGKIEQIIPVDLDRPHVRSGSDFLRRPGDILETLHFAGQPMTGSKN